MAKQKMVRIAAVSDIHYTKDSPGKARDILQKASEQADVLLICGDLTDYGLPEEAEVLAEDIRKYLKIPMLAVLGNHDFESSQAEEVKKIMTEAGVRVLDGESTVIDGIGYAGVCGFGGGFGARMLNGWGEPLIKKFVQEAIDEAVKLEQALARLETAQKVVLLHYAPIRETVEGEPLEIFPFLGSSRLEGPLNRHNVAVAFHGHAHHGGAEGQTMAKVPVYNVSVAVIHQLQPQGPPFRIYEAPWTSHE